jgi:membrane-associated phospholipid phosphatase
MPRSDSLMADYQVKRAKFVYIALFLVLLVGWSALLLGM